MTARIRIRFPFSFAFFRKKYENQFDFRIFRSIILSGYQKTRNPPEQKNNLETTGDTIKKTINKTLAIGVALTATAILAPATFARDYHEPPTNGIRLAADIVNLVRAIFEPLPAPVIVERPPAVLEKTVVVETVPPVVETTRNTIIVTGAEEIGIPEYRYVCYEDEYIPYYEGWLFYNDIWVWGGTGVRPAFRPNWTPPPKPRHYVPPRHKIIDPPEHRPDHRLPPVFRHEERRPEPPRTTVVKPERREVVVTRPERKETAARTERKEVLRERKEKEKVTVIPERRHDAAPKKGR